MTEPLELDDLARRVISDGRHAFDPSELVTARVRRAVENELARGAGIPKWHEARRAPGWVKMLFAGATTSVATGALAYAAWWPKATVAPATAPIPTLSVEHAAQRPATSASATETTPEAWATPLASEVRTPVTRVPAASTNKSESLAEEVKLLVSVNSAIQSRDAEQAARLLRIYDQQFKKPQLREERAAAGVLALCAAGRIEAARAAAKRFQATWPRSPLTARVVDSCIASK